MEEVEANLGLMASLPYDSKYDSDKKYNEFLFFTKEELIDVGNELSLNCFNKSQEYLSLNERVDSLEAHKIAMERQFE